MQENEHEIEDNNLPVAEEIDNLDCITVAQDVITANNLDNKYILIYKNSKTIKILITLQGVVNLILAILIHYWYMLFILLCYIGHYGVSKYKYKYVVLYEVYLFIDFSYHIINFIYNFNDISFIENIINFFIPCVYIRLFYVIENYIKSIKYLTEDEILLLKSIKITPSNVESQNILLI